MNETGTNRHINIEFRDNFVRRSTFTAVTLTCRILCMCPSTILNYRDSDQLSMEITSTSAADKSHDLFGRKCIFLALRALAAGLQNYSSASCRCSIFYKNSRNRAVKLLDCDTAAVEKRKCSEAKQLLSNHIWNNVTQMPLRRTCCVQFKEVLH